jgi:hypothetical protein
MSRSAALAVDRQGHRFDPRRRKKFPEEGKHKEKKTPDPIEAACPPQDDLTSSGFQAQQTRR